MIHRLAVASKRQGFGLWSEVLPCNDGCLAGVPRRPLTYAGWTADVASWQLAPRWSLRLRASIWRSDRAPAST
jgi:hypothetical protein